MKLAAHGPWKSGGIRTFASAALAAAIASLAACDPNAAPSPGAGPTADSRPRTQRELEELFEASPQPVTRMNLSHVTAIKQAELRRDSLGLVVHASGTDASLLLPDITLPPPFIARLTVAAPVETTLQIFYLVRGLSSHDEAHSFSFPLNAGRNVLYCAFDDPSLTGALRLDPGTVPGEYVLEAVELREYHIPAD